jgi:hypothetical protein
MVSYYNDITEKVVLCQNLQLFFCSYKILFILAPLAEVTTKAFASSVGKVEDYTNRTTVITLQYTEAGQALCYLKTCSFPRKATFAWNGPVPSKQDCVFFKLQNWFN